MKVIRIPWLVLLMDFIEVVCPLWGEAGDGNKRICVLILQKQRSFAIQKRSRKKMCSLLGGSSQDLQLASD